MSHAEPGHSYIDGVKGWQRVIQSPGEFEIGGTFITGIAMHYVDAETGIARANIAYRIQFDSGITVLHLGDLAGLRINRLFAILVMCMCCSFLWVVAQV